MSTAVVNDAFGNVVGSVSGSGTGATVVWNAVEVGGYGLLPGSTPRKADSRKNAVIPS